MERRGPGRPRKPENGSGAPVAARTETAAQQPLTATQELQRLAMMRNANGGYLIKPPLDALAAAGLTTERNLSGTESTAPNAACKAVLEWLRAIAALGGPLDVELAWENWHVSTLSTNMNPKLQLLTTYETLKAECGKRHSQLVAKAEEEAQPAKIVATLRADLRQAEAQLEADKRRYTAPLETRVGNLRRALAAAEAKMMLEVA